MHSHFLDDEMYPGQGHTLEDGYPLSRDAPEGVRWWVHNYNWMRTKKTWIRNKISVVNIIAVDTSDIFLPVHDIVNSVRNCELFAKFIDTFFSPTDPLKDAGRLQHLLVDRGNTLKRFFGYLDQASIAMLPHTIQVLGLAIGSAADAAAVLGMQTWTGLNDLYVSVTPGAPLADLGPLPAAGQYGIMFPALTDDRVPIVVPAIAALAPKRILSGLYFPKAKLTATGALRLAESIRDMDALEVKYAIVLEPSDDWKPDPDEKSKISKILLKKMIIPDMYWSMNWLYR